MVGYGYIDLAFKKTEIPGVNGGGDGGGDFAGVIGKLISVLLGCAVACMLCLRKGKKRGSR